VQLPTGDETFERAPAATAGDGHLPVYALAGPDAVGLIAFIEEAIVALWPA
jgi:hypothetical protein